LTHWIKDANRDEHSAPPVWRELHAVEILNPTTPDEVLDGLRESLEEQFRAFEKAGKPVLSIKLRAEAYVPGDPPLD
jgi:hypothetical protein